jgi:hypothetical protein
MTFITYKEELSMKKTMIAGLLSLGILATTPYAVLASGKTPWTNVNAYETSEATGSLFNSENYDFTKYSDLSTKLQEIAKKSDRVSVEVKGKSADGRNLYVVTVSDTSTKGKHGYYQSLRKQMFKNPDKAQDFVDKHPDFKTPVLINASIHGTEFVGTDAALKLIERFATQNDDVTKSILDKNILVFNVDANPDGRYDATRFNGNGIDLNRDFITQSQPETKEMVGLITQWNPMVLLDLHGYVRDFAGPGRPGLIEPCTPPHNPNYEYDLYQKWALDQAKAMESETVADAASFKGDLYQGIQGAYIPQRDDVAGWDDYPPIFTPMYAMYHGAYGYTLESPTNDWDGVQWHYDTVMGALKFATAHQSDMIKDQIEVFKRGITFDHPTQAQGFMPYAYILPVNDNDPTVTEHAVQHLMTNDITVEQAKKSFTAGGTTYPAGTYIVPMDQAKAGLANTMLWGGEDITNDTPAMYDISSWSLPKLWGFTAVASQDELNVQTSKVNNVNETGTVSGKGPYKIPNSSAHAVHLANELLKSGVAVQRDANGDFYVAAQSGNTLKNLVQASGLNLQTATIPAGATPLHTLKVAILKDGGIWKQQSHSGTKLALEDLGFAATELTPVQVAQQGLTGYDAFVYSGTEEMISYDNYSANAEFGLQSAAQFDAFKSNVNAFVNGGGKYLAIGAGGSIAAKALGLTDVDVNLGNSDSNGIVKVHYNASPVTLGYNEHDLGFVYGPVWYGNTANKKVLATYENTADFFDSGHWINNALAKGQPVIVQEPGKNVTLLGLEAGFRDHTEYLFRLLSNGLFQ